MKDRASNDNRKPLRELFANYQSDEGLSKFLNTITATINGHLKYNESFKDQLKLSNLKSEEYRLERKKRHTKSLEEGCAIFTEIRKMRKKYGKQATRAPARILYIFLDILRRKSRNERMLGMLQLNKSIAEEEKRSLKTYHDRIKEAHEMNKLNPSDNTRDELDKAKFQLKTKSTSIVHLWREVGEIFSCNAAQKETLFCGNEELADLGALYLLDGGVVELADGDSCKVNTLWIQTVLRKCNEKCAQVIGRDPIISVTSITGVQSSGKSTLLNTMFGCNLLTSEAACTRGINITLIKSDKEWKSNADYMLVMDTEGICNQLFKKEAWYNWHNNWLASVSIIVSNTCILLSNFTDATAILNVLPTAMMCYQNSKKSLQDNGFPSKSLFFVYNRIDPQRAQATLGDSRNGLINKLKEDKGKLNIQQSELFSAYNYGGQVLSLRMKMDRKLPNDAHCKLTLSVWSSLLEKIVLALEQEDFSLSFETIIEMEKEIKFQNDCNAIRSNYEKACNEAFRKCKHPSVLVSGESDNSIEQEFSK